MRVSPPVAGHRWIAPLIGAAILAGVLILPATSAAAPDLSGPPPNLPTWWSDTTTYMESNLRPSGIPDCGWEGWERPESELGPAAGYRFEAECYWTVFEERIYDPAIPHWWECRGEYDQRTGPKHPNWIERDNDLAWHYNCTVGHYEWNAARQVTAYVTDCTRTEHNNAESGFPEPPIPDVDQPDTGWVNQSGYLDCSRLIDLIAGGQVPPSALRDTDGDGLLDPEDACPYRLGPRRLGGCPAVSRLSNAQLAELYAPYVHFHKDEVFWPLAIDDFIDHSTLRWRHDRKCADQKFGHVSAAALGSGKGPTGRDAGVTGGKLGPIPYPKHRCGSQGKTFRTDDYTRPFGQDYGRNGLPKGEGFYLNLKNSWRDGTAPTSSEVYDAAVPIYYEIGPKRQWIRYYMMYGWSAFTTGRTNQRCCHEGEWEGLSIKLNQRHGPVEVCMNSHHGGYRNKWKSKMIKKHDNTHPEVWVAQGTHALYPNAGSFKLDLGKIGRFQFKLRRFPDLTGNGRVWRTWDNAAPVNVKTQPWWGFGGAWGHGKVLSRLNPFKKADGIGPAGPPRNQPVPSDWPGNPRTKTAFHC